VPEPVPFAPLFVLCDVPATKLAIAVTFEAGIVITVADIAFEVIGVESGVMDQLLNTVPFLASFAMMMTCEPAA
jgi:hypothetical protein